MKTLVKRLFDPQGGSLVRSLVRSAIAAGLVLGILPAMAGGVILGAIEGVLKLGQYLIYGKLDGLSDDLSGEPSTGPGGESDS